MVYGMHSLQTFRYWYFSIIDFVMRIAIVTVSDSATLGIRDDTTGPLLKQLALDEFQVSFLSFSLFTPKIALFAA